MFGCRAIAKGKYQRPRKMKTVSINYKLTLNTTANQPP